VSWGGTFQQALARGCSLSFRLRLMQGLTTVGGGEWTEIVDIQCDGASVRPDRNRRQDDDDRQP
jgi:hypothetical protein